MLSNVDVNIPVTHTHLISFIIPVYNVKDYIRVCVSSILKLRDISFEIILVDDGSVDGSIDEIADLVRVHPTITVLEQENKGQAAARNSGLRIANGDYIFFVDSDDMIDAQAVEQFFLQIDGSEDVIIGDFFRWDGQAAFRETSLVDHQMLTTGDVMLQRFFLNGFEMVIGRNIYKHAFIKKNRLSFLEGVYYEDAEWTLRCLALAKDIRYINIPIYLYRNQRAGSTMNSPFSARKFHDLFKVAQTIGDFSPTIANEKTAAVLNTSASNLLLSALKQAKLSNLGVDPQPVLRFFKNLKLPLGVNRMMQYVLLVSDRLFFLMLKQRSL